MRGDRERERDKERKGVREGGERETRENPPRITNVRKLFWAAVEPTAGSLYRYTEV